MLNREGWQMHMKNEASTNHQTKSRTRVNGFPVSAARLTFAARTSTMDNFPLSISDKSQPSIHIRLLPLPNARSPSSENPQMLTNRPRDHEAFCSSFPWKV